MAAINVNVLKSTDVPAVRHRPRGVIKRESHPAQRADNVSITSDDLPVLSRSTRLRGRSRHPRIAECLKITASDPSCLRLKRVIDLPPHLAANHHVANQRGQHQRQRHTGRGHQR